MSEVKQDQNTNLIKTVQLQRKPSSQLPSQQVKQKPSSQLQSQQEKQQKYQNNNEQSLKVLDELQNQIKELTIQINTLVHQPNNSVFIDLDSVITKLLIKQKIFHQIKQEITKNDSHNNINNKIKEENQQSKLTQQKIESQMAQQSFSNQPINIKIQNIIKIYQNYIPTLPEITQRKNQFQQLQNDDGWTDATQSDAGQLDLDDIIVVDDEMIEQMHMSDQQQGNEQMQQEQGDQQEEVDLQQLDSEFTKGQESDQHFIFGSHGDKFCVSVKGSVQKNLFVSGGGDDNMLIFNLPIIEQTKQQIKIVQQKLENISLLVQKRKKLQIVKPIYSVKHTQTITKIEFSYDKQFIFSLTQKQLLCTSTKTYQTTKIQIDPPKDFCCHKFGGVFAVGLGYNIQIYNIKGFKHYDTYCLDEEVNTFMFTQNGKQIVAACDNKLRIITPKTSQIVKVTGNQFHHGQITAMSLSASTAFTGCIDGFVYATNLAKGNVLGSIVGIGATINNLQYADNYLIIGPSQNIIYWYDSNKLKKIFQNKLKGSSTQIIQLSNKNIFAVADIKGQIHLLDKRNPLKEDRLLKAGNTVHQMWNQNNYLMAACEDGNIRAWDLRKYFN